LRYTSIIVIALIPFLVSSSNAEQWGTQTDALIERPGTKVITGKAKDGAKTREIHLQSGVSFFETRRGNKISSYSVDRSGLNAVICIWRIYVGLKTAMEICPSGTDEDLKVELDSAIDRINRFILENSISPVTKAQLNKSIEKRILRARTKIKQLRKENPKVTCLSRYSKQMLKNLKSMPREKFRSGIDKLLSVPRPPVLNPCL
jgi:hypothetical protein